VINFFWGVGCGPLFLHWATKFEHLKMAGNSPLEQRITDLIASEVEGLGYDLVRVRTSGSPLLVLQIMAEKPDRTMDVDDCAKISRVVSEIFEEKNPIDSEYTLEVSSPGIARPLVKRKDFEDFKGQVVKVELKDAMDGRKRFRGILDGLEEDHVMIAVEGDVGDKGEEMAWGLPFEEIAEARLVMTDELVAEQVRAAQSQNSQANSSQANSSQANNSQAKPKKTN
jgi:ribosome maturation factor RimP